MPDKIFVDWDYSLAAVKFMGKWRFFYDIDVMFLLDYPSYHGDHNPTQGEFRYGTLIVDETNAEQWMRSMFAEVTIEQVPNLYLENTEQRMRLTFLINLDEKLWIGSFWHNDQTFLGDYQPQGWTAKEDLAINYLPADLKGYFV
ncbi:MAG: hypothetical protein LCI00_21500 [Chloroflexi bacterium]|nr:hypothetical protein [Chloroflexota bacterium]MCC6895029.1 hypothetical protein [Anaerolineae bacterium]